MMPEFLDELLRLKVERAGASSEHADVLATLIRSSLVMAEDGALKVLDRSGNFRIGSGPDFNDMTVDELIAEVATSKPSIFGRAESRIDSTPQSPAAPSSNETTTARVVREAAERRRSEAEAKAATPVPNPWAKGSLNVTQQVLIQARDPARAARLKAEAGTA